MAYQISNICGFSEQIKHLKEKNISKFYASIRCFQTCQKINLLFKRKFYNRLVLSLYNSKLIHNKKKKLYILKEDCKGNK